ncbi:MAG: GNAT family N-acetyltransferase [Isosphaeraceae bacterium]
MVPLDPAAARYVRAWLGPPEGPGLLALHHTLVYRPTSVWADAPRGPRSVLFVREGDGRIEGFGAGEAGPAVTWLAARRRPFVLHAPEAWLEVLRDRIGPVDLDTVETWSGPGVKPIRPPGLTSKPAPVAVVTRKLSPADSAAFTAAAPPWALRGWRTYAALMEHGAAFGVPHGPGPALASLAWVFDRAEKFEAIGVFTVPRFRRLGLGRAAASALIGEITRERGHVPIWSSPPENEPSRRLARSLGFSVAATETLMRWPSRDAEPETPS